MVDVRRHHRRAQRRTPGRLPALAGGHGNHRRPVLRGAGGQLRRRRGPAGAHRTARPRMTPAAPHASAPVSYLTNVRQVELATPLARLTL
ncbi:hypothetical protein SBRY_30900 [Actinacidiphila bryophytorum]|uniref:Uncharacterized protein n=1 Tax=Actinacidiphila bryophytorum TaxID=1436133 RepID=A0A9W4H210_9ACTN|nr:hypothetical protein SBRY_30900 [Actinacidiphila bryophytorum]